MSATRLTALVVGATGSIGQFVVEEAILHVHAWASYWYGDVGEFRGE